jgi:hypothetical protein
MSLPPYVFMHDGEVLSKLCNKIGIMKYLLEKVVIGSLFTRVMFEIS